MVGVSKRDKYEDGAYWLMICEEMTGNVDNFRNTIEMVRICWHLGWRLIHDPLAQYGSASLRECLNAFGLVAEW